jgi:hypothetical protein
MPEYPAHSGAMHHSIVFFGANYKSEINPFRCPFSFITCPSHPGYNLEVIVFNHLIFCQFMAADTIAICADLDNKKSNR